MMTQAVNIIADVTMHGLKEITSTLSFKQRHFSEGYLLVFNKPKVEATCKQEESLRSLGCAMGLCSGLNGYNWLTQDTTDGNQGNMRL